MVEKISAMFSRHVTVDLTRSPEEALAATGYNQYVNPKVVAVMPRGQAKEELFFFRVGRSVSDNELETEFSARGLKPASPFSLAKFNEDDPAFADSHPNRTHFKDAEGTWCYITFDGWDGERSVTVDSGDIDTDDYWCFAGVRT